MDDDAVLNALARLVTDRAAPPPAGRAAEVLAGVDPARIERYVESLLDKRVSELLRAAHRTRSVFPALGPLYRGWLARHPAPAADDVLPPGVREGLRALPFLASMVDPPWVADLLRFELYLAASLADQRERRMASGWAIHRFTGEEPPEAPHRYRFLDRIFAEPA